VRKAVQQDHGGLGRWVVASGCVVAGDDFRQFIQQRPQAMSVVRTV
jgi:hypothetical protein